MNCDEAMERQDVLERGEPCMECYGSGLVEAHIHPHPPVYPFKCTARCGVIACDCAVSE